MPITADADYYLDSSPRHYKSSGSKMYCPFSVDKDDVIMVDVQVYNTAGDEFYASLTLTFDESDLEAEEGAGTGEFTQMKSVVEQAVVTYLESIAGNSGVTFTIA